MKRILLAALVAGWFSCSPGYESGKTKCSASGECPEGFVCNQRNLCVTEGSSGTAGNRGTGGRTSGSGGSTGTLPPPTGSAKIKFCHVLATPSNPSLALTLDIDGTRITAATSNCQPASSCLTVSAGSAVPISLLNGSTTVISGTINIPNGKELIMRATLDSSDEITVEANPAQGICSGGTGTTGTLAKFCNLLAKNSGDFVVTLVIGGTSISALTGNCSPIGTCSSITSGTDVPFSLLDGSTTLVSGTFPTIASGSNMLFRSIVDDDGTANINGGPYNTGVCSPASGSSDVADPIAPAVSSSAVLGDYRVTEISAIRDRTSPAVAPGVYRSVSGWTR